MSIGKNGVLKITKNNKIPYLVNNFNETGTTTDWTIGGSISNNKLVLTGASPQMTSKTFTVNPKDIIVIEFALAFTKLSDNSGVFIGTSASANTNRYNFDNNTKKWGAAQSNASSSWNTYWLNNYNSTAYKAVKGYIIGSEVDINDVPAPEGQNNAGAIQLTSGTTTNIRTGYDANTGMTYEVYYFKIYKLEHSGVVETNTNAKISSSYINANEFIEL